MSMWVIVSLGVALAAGAAVFIMGFFPKSTSAYSRTVIHQPYATKASGWHGKWSRRARAAGWKPRSESLPGNAAIALGCVTALGAAYTFGAWLALPLAAAPIAALYGALGILGGRRHRELEPALKDFSSVLADRAMRASLRDAFVATADDAEEPARTLLSPYVASLKSGQPLSEALQDAARDIDSPTFSMIAATVDASAESGAKSVSTALLRMSHSIRQRERARKEVVAEGRTTRVARHMFTWIPMTVVLFGILANPVPWNTPVGIGIIALVALISLGGRQLMVWLEKRQLSY